MSYIQNTWDRIWSKALRPVEIISCTVTMDREGGSEFTYIYIKSSLSRIHAPYRGMQGWHAGVGVGGGGSFQNSYGWMPRTPYCGHGHILLTFIRGGGGGVFPEFIQTDAKHPVPWPWLCFADVWEGGGGGELRCENGNNNRIHSRTDFGAMCVQLWICSAEPPGEHH